MTVDNYHLVAFSDACKYEVHKFGGLKSTILGGEGLVTEVTGPGDLYLQTKNISEFARWLAPHLIPYLPREEGGGRGFAVNAGGFTIGKP